MQWPSVDRRIFVLAAGAAGVVRADLPALRVALTTGLGVITLDLAADKAPITVANFLRYVDAKRFEGATFYRAVHAGSGTTNGLVQGGLRNDPTKVFPPIAHESTTTTGLHHVDGTISMARYDPGSAQAEFFICAGDQLYLDADPTQPGESRLRGVRPRRQRHGRRPRHPRRADLAHGRRGGDEGSDVVAGGGDRERAASLAEPWLSTQCAPRKRTSRR